MTRVPYFAGAGLLAVVAVVGLNWGPRAATNTAYRVPTVSVTPESIQLFSAFGGSVEGHNFPEPPEGSSPPSETRVDQNKLPPKARSAKTAAKITTSKNQKKPPVVANSGHIL
jgi:hypothetical protein